MRPILRRLALSGLLVLAGLAVLGGMLPPAVASSPAVTTPAPPPPAPPLGPVYGAPRVYGWTSSGIRGQIARAAAEYGVSYARLLRVAQCESGLNPSVTNPYSGAAGLFQFMWATFNSWVRYLWWQPGTWLSPYNPRVASRLAAWAFSRGYAGAWACSYIVGGLRYGTTPPPLWKNWLKPPTPRKVARHKPIKIKGHKHHPTATPTRTPTRTPTSTPTRTPTSTPTSQPTAIAIATATATRAPLATATALATATRAPAPTSSPTGVVSISSPTPTQVPPAATATPVVNLPPGPAAYFGTLPPGAALPSDADCTARVRAAAGEVRTDNDVANHTTPTAAEEQAVQSASWAPLGYGAGDPNLHRVTGAFVGTTDQIIQWTACKWGIDENIVRAQATNESHWHQNDRGDYTTNQAWCPPGTIDSTGGCYQSYGLLQIKWHWEKWTWPMSRDMTSFNADHVYAVWRTCYNGDIGYLQTNGSGYKAGDLWGCIGFWFSGQWHDSGATTYIGDVQGYLATKPWLSWPGWTTLPPTAPPAGPAPTSTAPPAPLATPTTVPPPTPTSAPASAGAPFSVSYTGTDYYYPADYFGGCGNWTWLSACYTHNPSGGSTTEQAQLASDAPWIAAHHLGQYQRVWAILDQGIRWTNGTYGGLDPTYLANLDDALATFDRAGIRTDLVLYEASKGSADQNQFQVAALDGSHPALRSGYLQALRELVTHLAANPVAVRTVAVMDLFNEAYFQLERFGYSDATIHQWLSDLYATAHGTAPGFSYTVSDTTRLLKDAATWVGMYPADVYDIHVYDNTPWANAALYAAGKLLPKPWFSGEAGCAPGNVGCTYDGTVSCTQPSTCALSVDSWWLTNLRADGARAVLIEERNTAWSYPSGPNSQTPTLVGAAIQATAP